MEYEQTIIYTQPSPPSSIIEIGKRSIPVDFSPLNPEILFLGALDKVINVSAVTHLLMKILSWFPPTFPTLSIILERQSCQNACPTQSCNFLHKNQWKIYTHVIKEETSYSSKSNSILSN